MRPSSSSPDQPRCIVCRAPLARNAPFCMACGARQEETPAEKLRGVEYLLGELERWEQAGIITHEQAAHLRGGYEETRVRLHAQLSQREAEPAQTPVTEPVTERPEALSLPETPVQETPAPEATAPPPPSRESRPYVPLRRKEEAVEPPPPLPSPREPRTLIETLTDPHNLRLLLYTGAAMIVVSVVLWLRDVLYLKLQEPVVQAGLLATATVAFMASGWWTTLRTRQRLTGRALTLIGSVLVPVNFWFLVRSGLIENHGRAWVVCAFCTLLYTYTAALLHARLYVYLAAAACVATGWALVFRTQREAYGLYALTWMLASLAFLHLSRIFPMTPDDGPTDEKSATINGPGLENGRWSYELWSGPLVQAGLVGATLSALAYLPLRVFGPTLSLYDGLFHLRTSLYDASIGILLFAALAYAFWFAGRFIYPDRRTFAVMLSALALCGALLLTLDGFQVEFETLLLGLSAAALLTALAHRIAYDRESALGLFLAGLLISLPLTALALLTILSDAVGETATMRDSAAVALLAASFAVLSGPRFTGKSGQALLAYLCTFFASCSFLLALGSAHVRAERFFAVCAAWPFALYCGAALLRRRSFEQQLARPFVRMGDVEFALLLIVASLLAVALHVDPQDGARWRASVFCVLLGAGLYGALRAREAKGAPFGAGLAAMAVLVLTASLGDTLKQVGILPGATPIAALVICMAFLLPKASAMWLPAQTSAREDARSPLWATRQVADLSVIICGLWWFSHTVNYMDGVGVSAPFVLLLALLYWAERAWRGRAGWMADLAFVCAGATLFALLAALRVETRWFALVFAATLPPALFVLGQEAGARGAEWLARHAHAAAWVAASLAFAAALMDAASHARTGERLLLAPCLTIALLSLLSFAASVRINGPARVPYFRAGIVAAVISFALACLRAGLDPWTDLEIYTSPVAVAMLLLGYLSVRREWGEEYEQDTSALLWLGSLGLCAPLLFHALEFRLLRDVPAPWRDLGVLCASLALVLFGVLGRLRAPVQVGVVTMLTELLVLTVTSVHWTQVPLKVYLITVGSLLALVGWMLEFRRAQLMAMRDRFNQQREIARERFGEWR